MHKYDHYAEHIDGDKLKEEQVDDIVCCALEKIKVNTVSNIRSKRPQFTLPKIQKVKQTKK